MYPHLLDKVKKLHPEWKGALVKNTLLVVALLLEEKTVSLWKLKGSVGKLLGNTGTDSRSHYQRLKRWLRAGQGDKGLWVNLLRAAVSLLQKQAVCLILDGSSWKWGGKAYHFLSVLYQGVSVPVWWLELGRLGISSQWHRKLLLRLALVLAYTLSVVYGLKKYRRAVKPKKHGSSEMSVFRWGLDQWQNHL